MGKYFDTVSITIIGVTFALFAAALFVKGLTQDILLEAGVFLVSLKLIVGLYKQQLAAKELRRQLDEIRAILERMENRPEGQ
jgi:hypothetical protein